MIPGAHPSLIGLHECTSTAPRHRVSLPQSLLVTFWHIQCTKIILNASKLLHLLGHMNGIFYEALADI